MKSCSVVCLLIGAVSCVPLYAQDGYGEPVIPASAFTEGLGVYNRLRGNAAIDPEIGHESKGSLRIDDAGSVLTDYLVIDGQCWKLSFWMKTRDVVRGPEPWHRAGGQVQFFDADKKSTGKGHFDIGLTLGTTDWAKHEKTVYFPPKAGVKYVRLMLMNWNCTGATWFDDVTVVTAPIPEAFRKVPPLRDVENRPARTWPMPQLISSQQGEPSWEPEWEDPEIYVSAAKLEVDLPTPEGLPRVEKGFDIDRGYMTRQVVRLAGGGPGPDGVLSEHYCEYFRGSPIVSVFMRRWLPNAVDVQASGLKVSLKGPVARVRQFKNNTLRQLEPREPITLGPETTKPFIILSNEADDAGVVLFHPIPPELRRWHVEDYVVEGEMTPTIEQTVSAGDEPRRMLTYRFPPISTGPGGFCHSLDFYVFWMPYQGSYQQALAEFQLGRTGLLQDKPPFSAREPRGYWEPYMSNASGARVSRMARYFPREFSSWMDSSGWDYGHEGGHGWGCTTATMKGIRVAPNAKTALARDYAWRMLTFFVEGAGDGGAPPNMYTWRGQAALLDDPEQHYSTVFCQYWEYRLGEFREWLKNSALLADDQKEGVYQELQRARNVFEPAREATSWTYPTPNGGYWFEYFNKPRGRRRWVLNTHATSVGNAGEFALMAREMGKPDDYKFWQMMFERGVDGLVYAWERPDMWADWDHNEVLYALPPDGGPRGYHKYMVTAWTPRIVRCSMQMGNYRLADLVNYWRRMASAEYTKDVVFEDLPGAREALAALASG